MNALLLIPIAYGALGMLGIIIVATQSPHIFGALDDTSRQLNQASTNLDEINNGLSKTKTSLSQDFKVDLPMENFKANFKDMGTNLRATANSLNNICVGKVPILGGCLYTPDLSEQSNNLRAVANNIENIPNTIPSSVTVPDPLKDQAKTIDSASNSVPAIKNAIGAVVGSIPTIKRAIIGLLVYKFLEHLSFFCIGFYLFLHRRIEWKKK